MRPGYKISPETIERVREALVARPWSTVAELGHAVGVSVQTVRYGLDALGVTDYRLGQRSGKRGPQPRIYRLPETC